MQSTATSRRDKLRRAAATVIEALEGRTYMTTIAADFTGGNGTSSVDQYAGTTGSGWDSAWTTAKTRSNITASVVSTSPLNGGGNYLAATMTATDNSARAAVGRAYETYGDINTGQLHQVQVDIRLDSSLSTFTHGYDRLYLFTDNNIRFAPGVNDSNFILAGAYGDVYDGLAARTWGVVDGDGSGGGDMVSSGISLTQGTVYRFTFLVDPVNKLYQASITDGQSGAGHSFTSGWLGWDYDINVSSTVEPWIMAGGRVSGSSESMSFSIDTVRVTPPPASNAAPTVGTAAAASPSPATGVTANLSALGADDGGEANLTYTWSVVSKPSGAADPSYSANGTNAAKASTATFNKAGQYTLRATISDGSLSTTSDVNLTVNQTLTTIVVTPAEPALALNANQQFTATGKDQFGNDLTNQPSFTWSVTSGVGSIGSSTGLYNSGATAGNATITATSGAITGNTTTTVNNTGPTVATPASGPAGNVTGTTANLSVLGADDGGEANLTYTWSVTSKPSGAADPVFSLNGSNVAKDTVATFSQAGSYTFRATISDGTTSVTSDANVTVAATITTIALTPASTAMSVNGTKQFAAVAKDQFGLQLASQPTMSWSVIAGGGSVNSSGLYTAAATTGTSLVRASSDGVYSDATVIVTNQAPTITQEPAATPNPITGTTASLTVRASDDGGEANLTYTWSTFAKPAGAADVQFSANENNAAKDTTATFSMPGSYILRVKVSDGTFDAFRDLEVNVIPPPPAAPDDLVATPEAPDLVVLTWDDNSSNEAAFVIERKTGSGGTWTTLATTVANTTSYSDFSAQEGEQYYYRVKAANGGGASSATGQEEAITQLYAPTGVRVSATSPTSKVISWLDNSEAESGFTIERFNGTSWEVAGTVGPNTTSYTDSDASGGAQQYRVRAAGDNNSQSEDGSYSQSGPQQPLLTVTVSDENGSAFDLEYEASDDAYLQLEVKGPHDDNFRWSKNIGVLAPNTPVSDSFGGLPNTTYSFRLRATLNGQSVYSSISATTDSSVDEEANEIVDQIPPPANVQASGIDVTFTGSFGTLNPDGTSADYRILFGNVIRTDDPFGLHDHMSGWGPNEPIYDQSENLWRMSASSNISSGATYETAIVVDEVIGWDGTTPIYETVAASDPFTYTMVNPPVQPVEITATPEQGGGLTVSWSASDLDGWDYISLYYVYNGEATSANAGGWALDGSTVISSPLPNRQIFAVRFRDIMPSPANSWGYSAYSNFVNSDGKSTPVEPTGLEAVLSNPKGKGDIYLTWDNTPSNETEYRLMRSYDGFAPQDDGNPNTDEKWYENSTNLTLSATADVTNLTDSDEVLYGMTYAYRVWSANGDGTSLSEDGSTGWSQDSVSIARQYCPTCGRGVNASGQDPTAVIRPDEEPAYLAILAGTPNAPSALTVVYGQERQRYFDANGASFIEDPLSGAGRIALVNGQYIFTDESGEQFVFAADFAKVPAAYQAKYIEKRDAGGNTEEATRDQYGRVSSVSVTPNGSSNATEQTDFGYITGGINDGRKLSAVHKVWNGSGWVTTRQQVYSYHDGTNARGSAGDLKTVVVKDAGNNVLSTTYYRYYTAGQGGGYEHGVKLVLSDDSIARAQAAYSVSDLDTLSDAELAPYADTFYKYDEQQRIVVRRVQGEGCSSCTGGQGTYKYSYASSAHAGDLNSWSDKVVETMPDGNQNITYYNYLGQAMLEITRNVSTGEMWGTYHVYDSEGREVMTANPSAVQLPASLATIEAYADLLNNQSGNYQYVADAAGLIQITEYDANNYVSGTKIQRGDTTTAIQQSSYTYEQRSAAGGTIYVLDSSTVYRGEGGTGAQTTSYDYTWYTDSLQYASQTIFAPIVSAAQNGPGGTDHDTTVYFYDAYGRIIWTRDAEGYMTYSEYDPITGGLTRSVEDADPAQISGAPIAAPARGTPGDPALPTALHLMTQYQTDELGRTVKETDPNGNVTWTVYNDDNYEYRVYRGWDAATNNTLVPVEVYREDRAGGYTESLTFTWSKPGGFDVDASGMPTGAEHLSDAEDWQYVTLQSLSRTYTNAGGQVIESRAYFNLSGVGYSTSASLGTKDTHYYSTTYGYDLRGRQNVVTSPTGTITRTTYDVLGRTTGVWVGTDDNGASGIQPFNSASVSNNMRQVAAYEYDNGGIGDSSLTKLTQIPSGNIANAASNRVSEMYYDWRSRQVASKAAVEASESSSDNTHFISYTEYDNLNQAIARYVYDGDGIVVASTNGVPNPPPASPLRAKQTADYDEQGRVFRATTFSVDPTNGNVSSTGLVSDTFYDRRGNVIKTEQPGGLVSKMVYDGAGRLTKSYVSDGGGDDVIDANGSTWEHARNVDGDIVLEQYETQYDAAGNAILSTTRQRFHDAPLNTDGDGELGNSSSPVGTAKARVSYQAMYYDTANRLTDITDVGTNGGSAYTRPSTVAARSDTNLVTSYEYDAAGYVKDVTDPKGIESRTLYDALGRTTKTIANYVDGMPSDADDQTTSYTYDGNGNVLTLKAELPGTDVFQETKYIYQARTSTGSDINSNDTLTAVQYPDLGDGEASPGQQETFTVNALGQTKTKTDRNGTVHTYSYDVLGRPTTDAVTTLGSGVDGAIRSLGTEYDSQGNAYRFTSYSTNDGTGTPVNQVQREFNGFGQLITEYQAVNGAVNTGLTPKVQYAYSEMASGANRSRLTSMTYPNGRIISYDYSTHSVDDSISRITSLSESAGELEVLSYLGLGTVISRHHSESGIEMRVYHSDPLTPNGEAGDKYSGLDRFGRVVDHNWVNLELATTGEPVSVDRYSYGYDRNGNRLYKENALAPTSSELYAYDGLNRLTSMQRGTLDSGKTALDGSATRSQAWNMDALGNSDSVTTDSSAQARQHNAQNQLTEMGGSTLTFDNNGNQTTDETGKTLVYDAWNRLVEAEDGSTSLIRYEHDALIRRIQEGTAALYYTAGWQAVEERDANNLVTQQYVWSPVYVDALVARDRDTNADGMTDERVYVLQDANFDVTAITGNSGSILERFQYDAYGARTVLSASWIATAAAYSFQHGRQGGKIDAITGYIHFRHRELNTAQMRWMQQDPLGYIDGTSRYQHTISNPFRYLDPVGTNSAGGAIGVAMAKVTTARAALAAAIAIGSTVAVQQKERELTKALRELQETVEMMAGGQASEAVVQTQQSAAETLATAAIVHATSQAEAAAKCEQLQVQIDIHFGKLAQGSPDPGGPWDHWLTEIRGWAKTQQNKLKHMGKKTRATWEERIATTLRRAQELSDQSKTQMVITMNAIKTELTTTRRNGKEVLRMGEVILPGYRKRIWYYADGTKEVEQMK